MSRTRKLSLKTEQSKKEINREDGGKKKKNLVFFYYN